MMCSAQHEAGKGQKIWEMIKKEHEEKATKSMKDDLLERDQAIERDELEAQNIEEYIACMLSKRRERY